VLLSGYSEDRVRKGAEKLSKFLNTKQQGRLDGFFTVKSKDPAPGGKGKDDKKGGKRKASSARICSELLLTIFRRTIRKKEVARKRKPESDTSVSPLRFASVLVVLFKLSFVLQSCNFLINARG
jgi:hypothetical protein